MTARAVHRPLQVVRLVRIGVIAAEKLGFARVAIERASADGNADCRVGGYLTTAGAGRTAAGREYFQG